MVLVGDQKQLDAVGAGAAFAQLQRAGLRVAIMDDIQRQRDPQLLDAVKFAIAGDVSKAFENISRIQQADEISKAAAEAWLSMRLGQQKNVGVIALTNNARKEINLLIRDELKAQGLLAQDDVKLAGLSPLGLTRAEQGDASSYAKGDIIVPIRSISSKNLKANHQYEIVDQNIQSNTITLQALGTTQSVTLTLSQKDRISGNLSGNRPEVRGFAAGDEVRFTITDKDNGVLNAMRGTLDAVTDKAITLTTPEGNTIDVPRSSIGAAGMDHAYALTAHGFQGHTVAKIILTMSAREQLATQKAFYVGVSRAKDVARLITDDPVKLSDRLHKMTGERPAALDALAQAERDRADKDALSKEADQVRDDKTKDKIEADMRVEKAIQNIDRLQSEAREKWGPDLTDREIGERTR